MYITNTPQLNFTSCKPPRYLYHITSTANIESIKEKGLRKSVDGCRLGPVGVFLFDLPNLIKNWTVHKDWQLSHLTNDLFEQAACRDGGLSIIRIPIKNIDKNKIRVRSQNILLSTKRRSEHNSFGLPLNEAKALHKKGNAIEYILYSEIPSKDFEVVNSTKRFRKLKRNGGIKAVLMDLFKNQPEHKYIEKAKIEDSYEWNKQGESLVTKYINQY